MNNLTNDGFNYTHWIRFQCYCYSSNPLVAIIRTKHRRILSFILSFLFCILWKELSNGELIVENESTLCLFFQEYNLTLCIFKLSILTTTKSSHFVYCLDFPLFVAVRCFASNFDENCNPMGWHWLPALTRRALVAFYSNCLLNWG